MESVLENIKQIRKQKLLTQKDMAEKLSITQAGYNKIESGSNDLSYKMLQQIADVFEMSVVEVIGYPNGNIDKKAIFDEQFFEMEREIRLLQKELELNQYENKIINRQSKYLQISQENELVQPFISDFSKFRFTHKSISDLYEDVILFLVGGVFNFQEIHLSKEYGLVESFLFYTIEYIQDNYFSDSGNKLIKMDISQTPKEEIILLFSGMYDKYMNIFLENFEKQDIIELYIRVGLINTKDLISKFLLVCPKEDFCNILYLFIMQDLKPFEKNLNEGAK